MARPTKYKPEYCDKLLELMGTGASKAEVALEFDVSYQTFLNWQEQYPEFLEAVKSGEKKSQGWWERLGRLGAGGATDINPTVYIFNMKNRFRDDWMDAQRQEHTGQNGGPIQHQNLDDAALEARVAALMAQVKP